MTVVSQTIDPHNGFSELYKNAFKIAFKRPKYGRFLLETFYSHGTFLLKMLKSQKKATQRRAYWLSQGVEVPPILIFSVTNQCNLKCKGCYSHAQARKCHSELNTEKMKSVIREAQDLGVSTILMAGGEPFTRKDLLEITREFPDMLFPVFTNGMLLNDELISELKRQKHVIPIISLEGYKTETDLRRGKGVFAHLQDIRTQLKDQKIIYGTSFTITRENFDLITDEDFIENFIDKGCKVNFFVEYVPVQEGTENLMLTEEQVIRLTQKVAGFKEKFPILFISFSSVEEKFGGCISSGKGFIHISPDGSLEPCPFAPYSDSNLNDVSLMEGLKSVLFKKIRANHEILTETTGACALWENRDWVKSLLI